jgi:hypothetical protein
MKPRPVNVIQCLVTAFTLSVGYVSAESYDYDDDYSETTTNKDDRQSSQYCYNDFGSFQKDFDALNDDSTDSRSFS